MNFIDNDDRENASEAPAETVSGARLIPRITIQAFCEHSQTAQIIEDTTHDRRMSKVALTTPGTTWEELDAFIKAERASKDFKGWPAYGLSKAALAAYSMSLAAAHPNVLSMTITPGFIETAMTESLGVDQHAKLMESVPAGRLGNPEDVAACAVFLASDEASYVTGQTLHVNGGMAML